VGSGVGAGVGSGVGTGVGSGVGGAVSTGVEPVVADGVGLGVGLGVGFGVAFTPQLDEEEARFVLPVPAEGIVLNPTGLVPVGVNRAAARARIALRSGTWIEPRLS
jgi:hypothetical protein